jgi:hypothetical protein
MRASEKFSDTKRCSECRLEGKPDLCSSLPKFCGNLIQEVSVDLVIGIDITKAQPFDDCLVRRGNWT